MKVWALLALPLLIAWQLVMLAFWPVLLIVVAWWLLPSGVAAFVTWLVVIYLVVVLQVFRLAWRGKVRSMARGTVRVRRGGRRRGGR
jgi:hypothetical protein